MIKVLIAEDSVVFQKVLVSFLKKESNIEVVGVVDNGIDAVDQCKRLKPDLITMDIFMPRMNGLDATRRIMAECPTRIVIISSMIDAKNLQYSLEAIQAGAVEVIAKPQDMITGNYNLVKDKLIKVLRQTMDAEPMKRFSWLISRPWEAAVPSMVSPYTFPTTGDAGGAVSTRTPVPKATPDRTDSELSRPIKARDETDAPASVAEQGGPILVRWRPQPIPRNFIPHLIFIGGSTGAPAVISDVLRCLPGDFSIPILVAQHIVRGFVKGMADWLNGVVKLDVGIAENGLQPRRGQVLFAPDDTHLIIAQNGCIELAQKEPDDLYVPSVNRLFSSAAHAVGAYGLGIVLSGMGKDGADGLLEMRNAGAVTIGQNAATSVVYGMPKVAMARGALMNTMGPEGMVRLLLDMDERVKTKMSRESKPE